MKFRHYFIVFLPLVELILLHTPPIVIYILYSDWRVQVKVVVVVVKQRVVEKQHPIRIEY